MIERHKLLTFLKRAMRRTNEDEPCRAIVLFHAFNDKDPVRPWDELSDNSDTGIDMIATSIMSTAENDAHGLGGAQRYQLKYFIGNNTTAQEYISFHCHGPSLDEADESSSLSEGPTTKGGISMYMRHEEGMFKLTLGAAAQQIADQRRDLEDLRAYVRQLEENRLKNAEIYEELLSKKHDRDLETTKLANSERRKEAIISRVMPVIPLLINKISGRNLLPEAALSGGGGGAAGNIVVDGIKKWFETLTPEQFGKFKEALTDEQLDVIIRFYQEFQSQEASASSNGIAGITQALVPTGN